MIVEIFWNDLTPEKQEELISKANETFDEEIFPGNYDVFPLASLEIDDDFE